MRPLKAVGNGIAVKQFVARSGIVFTKKKREIKTLNSINAVPIASNCIRINHDHCWKTCIVSLPEFPSALRSSNFTVFFVNMTPDLAVTVYTRDAILSLIDV